MIETVLRQFVDWSQHDWLEWLPLAVSAICGRDSASTGTNSFFLSHGWNQSLFKNLTDELPPKDNRDTPITKADRIIRQLKEVRE